MLDDIAATVERLNPDHQRQVLAIAREFARWETLYDYPGSDAEG
jgi:hypothetical protein